MLAKDKMRLLLTPFKGIKGSLKKLGISSRVISAVIDPFAIMAIVAILSAPLFIYNIYHVMTRGTPSEFDSEWFTLYGSFILSIFINKDALGGRSIGKRMCGVVVISRGTNQVASPFRCLLRNLTLVIWPAEVLVLLITDNKRIGDLIANTEIVETPEGLSSMRISWTQVVMAILMGVLLFFSLASL